jgi:Uma2 family endonuclease
MIKYTSQFLLKLEDLISESDYILRYEKGNFKSGYCLLKEQKIMIVNKFFTTEGKINALLEILRNVEFDTSRFSEKNLKLYEELNMSPAPSISHQKIIFSLIGQLYLYIESNQSGIALMAPVDVFLDDENVFQPDIVFVTDEKSSIIQERGIFGAPDLIVEVLSPGSRSVDLGEKKQVYEQSGIKEYWVIDVTTRRATGFQLAKGKFVEFASEKDKINSPLLKHVFTF